MARRCGRPWPGRTLRGMPARTPRPARTSPGSAGTDPRNASRAALHDRPFTSWFSRAGLHEPTFTNWPSRAPFVDDLAAVATRSALAVFAALAALATLAGLPVLAGLRPFVALAAVAAAGVTDALQRHLLVVPMSETLAQYLLLHQVAGALAQVVEDVLVAVRQLIHEFGRLDEMVRHLLAVGSLPATGRAGTGGVTPVAEPDEQAAGAQRETDGRADQQRYE